MQPKRWRSTSHTAPMIVYRDGTTYWRSEVIGRIKLVTAGALQASYLFVPNASGMALGLRRYAIRGPHVASVEYLIAKQLLKQEAKANAQWETATERRRDVAKGGEGA